VVSLATVRLEAHGYSENLQEDFCFKLIIQLFDRVQQKWRAFASVANARPLNSYQINYV
jgi:hypothetical protein